MADGYDIHLEGERARKLERAAKAAGVTPAEFALKAIDGATSDEWTEALEAFADYERTGEYVLAEDALAKFERDLDARLTARGK